MSKCIKESIVLTTRSKKESRQGSSACPSSIPVPDISRIFRHSLLCLFVWPFEAIPSWCDAGDHRYQERSFSAVFVFRLIPLSPHAANQLLYFELQPVETCHLLSLFICAKRQEARSRTAEKGRVVEMEINCKVFNISIGFVTLYHSTMSQQSEFCSDHRSQLESA